MTEHHRSPLLPHGIVKFCRAGVLRGDLLSSFVVTGGPSVPSADLIPVFLVLKLCHHRASLLPLDPLDEECGKYPGVMPHEPAQRSGGKITTFQVTIEILVIPVIPASRESPVQYPSGNGPPSIPPGVPYGDRRPAHLGADSERSNYHRRVAEAAPLVNCGRVSPH